VQPGAPLLLVVHARDGTQKRIDMILRAETEQEIRYLAAGGLLQHVFARMKARSAAQALA
jgi:aconitase A